MTFVDANQPQGTPTWIDLGVPDLDRALAFYGSVLGWTFDVGTPRTGYYTTCLLEGRAVAAMLVNPDPGAVDFSWNVYLAADDADATAARAVSRGASPVVEPVTVPEMGRMAILVDPVGAKFGLWEGHGHVGCEVLAAPGALLHVDLITPAPGAAHAFYEPVFGLSGGVVSAADPATSLFGSDGQELAAVWPAPAGSRSAWAVTFQVADVAAAVEVAELSGGRVEASTTETDGSLVVALADPFGSVFSLAERSV